MGSGAGEGVASDLDGPLPAEVFALAFAKAPLPMSLSRVVTAPGKGAARTFVVNEAMGRMLGYSVEELLTAEDQRRFTHPDDLLADAEHVARLVTGTDDVTRWDKRYLHADGSIVWARVSLSVLRDDDGSPSVLIAHVEDITARADLRS